MTTLAIIFACTTAYFFASAYFGWRQAYINNNDWRDEDDEDEGPWFHAVPALGWPYAMWLGREQAPKQEPGE